MKPATPDKSTEADQPEPQSYWKIRFNEFRNWLRPRWNRLENAVQAQNREDDMPGNPDYDADRPRIGIPAPFLVICTAMITILATLFVVGGQAERQRESTPEFSEFRKQLTSQKRAHDAELAKARAASRSAAEQVRELEQKLETFDTERVRLAEANAKIEAERQRLETELEAARKQPAPAAVEPVEVVEVVELQPAKPNQRYSVRPGDTLFSIANRSGVSVETLVRINGLDSPNYVAAGQQLLLPAEADLTALNRREYAYSEPDPQPVVVSPKPRSNRNRSYPNAPKALRFNPNR